ncbi:MAG: hypothetical protein NUV80_05110 [Candidatus Berkelbacteria bacterium]|nr:hypothetical protein [Candidatus Berkelbacteria bacterium]
MSSTDYYKSISARGKLAIRQRKAEGESMHQAPLGYRNVVIEGRTVLERHPRKYRLVQEAKRMWQEGASLRTVCRVMQAKGLRTKKGKIIRRSSMYLVVKQP